MRASVNFNYKCGVYNYYYNVTCGSRIGEMDVRKKLAQFILRLNQDSDSRMSQLKLRRQKRMNIIRRRLDTIRRQSIKRMQLVLILVGFPRFRLLKRLFLVPRTCHFTIALVAQRSHVNTRVVGVICATAHARHSLTARLTKLCRAVPCSTVVITVLGTARHSTDLRRSDRKIKTTTIDRYPLVFELL